jgi:cellulose synthase/poly-beta-1,6-N-acetylglucosamine synthase-like glycosyltransferase
MVFQCSCSRFMVGRALSPYLVLTESSLWHTLKRPSYPLVYAHSKEQLGESDRLHIYARKHAFSNSNAAFFSSSLFYSQMRRRPSSSFFITAYSIAFSEHRVRIPYLPSVKGMNESSSLIGRLRDTNWFFSSVTPTFFFEYQKALFFFFLFLLLSSPTFSDPVLGLTSYIR